MTGNGRARRTVVIVAGIAVAIVGATWWMLARDTRGAEIANVIALPVSLLGLLATVLGWSLRSSVPGGDKLDTAVADLARDIARQESAELQRLLADTGDSRPADIGFVQPSVAWARWRTDGGGTEGSLGQIADFYSGLDRGRLVILGEPGAGKTVLAIELLINLCRQPPAAGTHRRAPLRLSASTFPGSDEGSPEHVNGVLDAWMTQQLITVYGQSRSTARELVRQGRILPVLDGLDEMDHGDGAARRARSLMTALNYPVGTGLRPAVVTCREQDYRRLAGVDHEGTAVQDATHVVVRPLTTTQIGQWLAYRFPDQDAPDGMERRWRPILKRLVDRPGGALATSLASPLRLFLTVTIYRDPQSRPRELLDLKGGDLDRHLFQEFIPAATAQHRRRDGTRYDPHDVRRWLTTLAGHLDHMEGEGRSNADIRVDELWRSVPGVATRNLVAVVVVLAALTCGVGVGSFRNGNFLPVGALRWVACSVYFVAVCWAFRRSIGDSTDIRRIQLGRISTSSGRRQIFRGALFGAAAGIPVVVMYEWIDFNPITSPHGALLFLLGLGVAGVTVGSVIGGVVGGLAIRPVSVGRPGEVPAGGIAYDVLVVGLSLLVPTLAEFLGYGIAYVLNYAVDSAGFWTGVGAATRDLAGAGWSYRLQVFCVGLMLGVLLRSASPWPRYLIAVHRLSRAGLFPRRPTRFLDWAYDAGLVRLSGIAVQFRHREFQAWLSRTPDADGPGAGTDRASKVPGVSRGPQGNG
ncbi:NACHT domain-containing protein [Actinoplanes bogorensis]|uniref:NACHT domain-containing protein n=1 Tax=Paractinoplanes bogorensis TaxID=1610840 RepID=A0ABS5YPT3_9ACTN|nr:NACHT domain-containing protein [Actinoplanes bogorensis]MBU2665456.1 NACHT domain-containing protein [Actinoplanes bogorensis]